MNQGPMATRPLDGLDPVIVLSACDQHADAQAIAERDLEALKRGGQATPRELARATRRLADALLQSPGAEAGETDEQIAHEHATVVEARRRHRPFAEDAQMSAEIGITAANHDYIRFRSTEAEKTLDHVLESTRDRPDLALIRARALRVLSHWKVMRGEADEGKRLVEEALPLATGGDGESLIFRLQLLFTRAELCFIVGERDQVVPTVQSALDHLGARLSSIAPLVRHGRARAAVIYRETGHHELADALDPK
jgi:hypothetical protein